MTLLWIAGVCVAVSFLAVTAKTFWLLKPLSGILWWILTWYWISNRPDTVTAGSPTDTGIIVLFIVLGIAMWLMTFWYSPNSSNAQYEGRFRLPRALGGKSDEEIAEANKPQIGWRERSNAYSNRLNSAVRGQITTRNKL